MSSSRKVALALLAGLLLASPAAAQTVCTGFTESSVAGITTGAFTYTGVTAGATLLVNSKGNTDETHTMTVADDSANGAWGAGGVSSASDEPSGTGRNYLAAFPNSVADDGTIIGTLTYSAAQTSFVRHVICSTPAGVTLEQFVTDADGADSSTTYASPATTTTCSAGTMLFFGFTNSNRTSTADFGTDVGAANHKVHVFYNNFSASGLQPTITITASSAARWTGHTVVLCDPGGGGGGSPHRARTLKGVGD